MLQQDNKKLNIIFLINNPSDREKDPLVKMAFDLLLKSFENAFNIQHRILILKYSLDENDKNRLLRLLEVQKNTSDIGIPVKKDISDLHDFGNVKFTEPIFLGLTLHYIKSIYSAKHTILIPWGHGYGVGLFKNKNFVFDSHQLKAADYLFRNEKSVILSKKITAPFVQKDNYQLNADRNETIDTIDVTDMLTNGELNDAIKIGYRSEDRGNKIDMLLFMNCDMMRFDTIYDLAASVKYIVGPETPISFVGYNYIELFDFINSKIDQLDEEDTWRDMCNNLTSKFMDAYNFQDADQKKFAGRTFITAVETCSIRNISAQLNELLLLIISNRELRQKFIPAIDSIKFSDDTSNSWGDAPNNTDQETRGFCFDLKNFDLIDIFQRFLSLLDTSESIKAAELTSSLITMLKDAIISIKPIVKDEFQKKFNGISITMPCTLEQMGEHPFFKDFNIIGSKDSDLFAYENYWSDFLPLLLKNRDAENNAIKKM